jgi:hypothetical protein
MAWTRTALALMAFGFVIERFGLFLHMFVVTQGGLPRRDASFWVGVSFIVLGAIVALISVLQYRSLLKTLKPIEIPDGEHRRLYQLDFSSFWSSNNCLLFLRLVMTALGKRLSSVKPASQYSICSDVRLSLATWKTSSGTQATYIQPQKP